MQRCHIVKRRPLIKNNLSGGACLHGGRVVGKASRGPFSHVCGTLYSGALSLLCVVLRGPFPNVCGTKEPSPEDLHARRSWLDFEQPLYFLKCFERRTRLQGNLAHSCAAFEIGQVFVLKRTNVLKKRPGALS